jgi:hypothetical protein
VIDQVMKNASCHDDKMEAYCKAVRALEDKFYGIELNHVPCRYNEEADELAKIASGRITIPPNVFARDVIKPSVDLDPNPSSCEEPSGTRTPRTRCTYSPCSRGMALTRPKPWKWSRSPARETGGTNTSPRWIEGSYPRTDPRPYTSPGWLSHSP